MSKRRSSWYDMAVKEVSWRDRILLLFYPKKTCLELSPHDDNTVYTYKYRKGNYYILGQKPYVHIPKEPKVEIWIDAIREER